MDISSLGENKSIVWGSFGTDFIVLDVLATHREGAQEIKLSAIKSAHTSLFVNRRYWWRAGVAEAEFYDLINV